MAGKRDEATLSALSRLKDMGVDLNRYLEAVALSGGRGGVVGVEAGGKAGGDPCNLGCHLLLEAGSPSEESRKRGIKERKGLGFRV